LETLIGDETLREFNGKDEIKRRKINKRRRKERGERPWARLGGGLVVFVDRSAEIAGLCLCVLCPFFDFILHFIIDFVFLIVEKAEIVHGRRDRGEEALRLALSGELEDVVAFVDAQSHLRGVLLCKDFVFYLI